jgi:hypothetical protein
VPVAYVRLRYAIAGHAGTVEGIDTTDAASVANLTVGSRVAVTVADGAPRQPTLTQASRTYWWRNPASDLAILGLVILGIVGAVCFIRRRRRARTAG